MKAKIAITGLSGIIVILIAALIIALAPAGKQAEKRAEKDFVLHRFDRQDIERLNEMVSRHADGKGDFLMLIPPIVDGGYWIHDVHSDGRLVTWTVDNTRDGMSSQQGKTVYRCKVISEHEQNEHHIYTLEQCEGDGEQDVPILSVPANGY